MLGQYLPRFRPAPVLALTATATPVVQNDIVEQLGLTQSKRFVHGFRRDNLAIEVVEIAPSQRTELTSQLLQEPDSPETMRIEFMAPEEFKSGEKDFRVDVQKGVHARACTGGAIAVAESEVHRLAGRLPDGSEFAASLRVTKSHALVMLKLLALDELRP